MREADAKARGHDRFSKQVWRRTLSAAGFRIPLIRKDGEDGRPLRLLAQLNLEELPALPDFPNKGILQFYIADGYDDLLGLDFDDPISAKAFRVIYHEDIVRDESLLQTPPPIEEGDFPVGGKLTLEAKLSSLPMDTNDFRFGEEFMAIYNRHIPTDKKFYQLPDDETDMVCETLSGSGHHIGVYATFIQSDPRDAGGRDDYTVLLLQVDSDMKDHSIMWGDADVANFFITPADLKKRDFSKVLYSWDCC